eukprot:TRINITY_DN7051_c0_g1_i1.p1 TRINITY_DN7051_c0_g1~~TRINITY_DN7051_c0_g1_i1.p1  ORF type:complete len:1112 (+),score=427.34 TRINITY_DN7051_c0_g1_i1:1242-4577(+)
MQDRKGQGKNFWAERAAKEPTPTSGPRNDGQRGRSSGIDQRDPRQRRDFDDQNQREYYGREDSGDVRQRGYGDQREPPRYSQRPFRLKEEEYPDLSGVAPAPKKQEERREEASEEHAEPRQDFEEHERDYRAPGRGGYGGPGRSSDRYGPRPGGYQQQRGPPRDRRPRDEEADEGGHGPRDQEPGDDEPFWGEDVRRDDPRAEQWQRDMRARDREYEKRDRQFDTRDRQLETRRRGGKEIEPALLQGAVCLLRDTFGFIRPVNGDEDIFFHFSEVIGSEDGQGPPVRLDTEVQFNMAIEVRSGKKSAANVEVLPRGTIKFEEELPERIRGVITQEAENDSTFAASAQGFIEYPVDASGKFLPDEKHDHVSYVFKNIGEPKVPLRKGDHVVFNILINRRKKMRRAVNVCIVKFGGARKLGKIHNTKDAGFGFIKAADSPNNMYFNFRNVILLQDGQDIEEGVEVEYEVDVDSRTKKAEAVRVRGLPNGTVTFETKFEGRRQGVVDREFAGRMPLNGEKTHPREEDLGLISFKSEDGKTETVYFAPRGLREPTAKLHLGDEVDFDMVLKRRTNRKKARDLVVTTAAELVFERGVISSLKREFGYINSPERAEEIFFRFGSFADGTKDDDAREGMEVEYRVVPESRNRKRAVDLKTLPAGSVKFEDVLDETSRGVVRREPRMGAGAYVAGQKRNIDQLGTIALAKAAAEAEAAAEGEQAAAAESLLGFGAADLVDKTAPYPGDEVEFNVAVDKRTGVRSATNVRIVKRNELSRERGVITAVKEGFGFIDSAVAEAEYYFSFSEVADADRDKLKADTEVEYSVVTSSWNSKKQAIRLTVLPPGSVKFTEVGEQKYRGTVERELKSQSGLRGRGRQSDLFGGQISYKPAGEDKEQLLEFAGTDIERRFSVRIGDGVEFQLGTDLRTKQTYATNIVPLKVQGIVKSLNAKAETGLIATRKLRDPLVFRIPPLEETGDKPLSVGDAVEFLLCRGDKGFVADDVARSKEPPRPVEPKRPSYPSGPVGIGRASPVQPRDAGFLLRQPTVPGGTGFSAGRGKLTDTARSELMSKSNFPKANEVAPITLTNKFQLDSEDDEDESAPGGNSVIDGFDSMLSDE